MNKFASEPFSIYQKKKERSGIRTDYSWIKYIQTRIRNNKNFLCITTGPTGSGKTWSTLAICEMLDPDFDEERIIFRGVDLMALINSGKLKRGSVILWDETQIDLNNRNWQSMLSKMLNYLLSTFRHRNIVLFFTSPYADYIDSASLKLFHANFETVKIDKTDNTVVIKPKQLVYKTEYRKFHKPFLKVKSPIGRMLKVKRWKVPKASQWLLKRYEEKKLTFTNALNKEIELKLRRVGNDGKVRPPLSHRQQLVYECWEEGITDIYEVCKKLDLTYTEASRMYTTLEKKGYYHVNMLKSASLPKEITLKNALLAKRKFKQADSNLEVITTA